MEHEQTFEGTTDEKLRFENELLKLKLQAELGAQFGCRPGADLPPEIEKQFLEQVLAFHRHLADHPPVPLREHLGNPVFQPSADLDAKALEAAWEELSALLEKKQVHVDFLAEYPLALKYDFIINELFDHETETPCMEGQFVGFIYEEFHPNFDYDIRRRTDDFMKGFFAGSFAEPGWYMADELITENGETRSIKDMQQLLDRFHGLFASIKGYDYHITKVSTQSDEEIKGEAPRLGFSEGFVRYTVVLNDGQEQEMRGPFKLYVQCIYECWEIFFFHMHGFAWTMPN